MNRLTLTGVGLILATTLTACGNVGPDGLIAQPQDTSFFDRKPLSAENPAIAYDPDGCQNWLIDDGAEGYASRRRDPRSGLPVCNTQFPPGTVVKEYRTNTFPDILPQ